MKILQIINCENRGGGAEKFVLDLSIALKRIKGISIDVLSIQKPNNDNFIKILSNNNINHHHLSDNVYSPFNVIRLYKFINNRDYDVIHVHLFPSLYYAGIIQLICKSKFKLIYTEHNTSNRRRNKFIFKATDSFFYRQYYKVIAISSKVKKNLEEHLSSKIYSSSNKIDTIYNGIDLDAIRSAPITDIFSELSIPKDATITTMVSRMTPVKDYQTLIKAIELLPKNHHAIFVGDGPLRTAIEDQVYNSTAKNRIHILGLRNDVFGILKASDIIVLSSKHEGFSIAMLEAMASGKPFVASSVEGIKDLVSDVAELFEYKNYQELSSILLKLSTNKEYYGEVADRCSQFAKKYDINTIAKQYLSVFQTNKT